MHFDLTDLRLFLKVHEARTITSGSAGAHMTPASASERIRGMEDSLGAPLLMRDRRGVQTSSCPVRIAITNVRKFVESQECTSKFSQADIYIQLPKD